jgi:hypothetical protein
VPLGEPLNKKRWWLGAFAGLMFLLTFIPAGIKKVYDDRNSPKLQNASLQRELEYYRNQRMKNQQSQPSSAPTTR